MAKIPPFFRRAQHLAGLQPPVLPDPVRYPYHDNDECHIGQAVKQEGEWQCYEPQRVEETRVRCPHCAELDPDRSRRPGSSPHERRARGATAACGNKFVPSPRELALFRCPGQYRQTNKKFAAPDCLQNGPLGLRHQSFNPYCFCMKKHLMLLALLPLAALSAQAQKMTEKQVPAAAVAALKKTHPTAKAVKWEKEDANYEASFKQGTSEMSVVFAAAGTLAARGSNSKLTFPSFLS